MKHRTIAIAGSFAKMAFVIMGTATALLGIACLIEGGCVCLASERES